MEKMILLVIASIVLGVIWAFPLYACINLVLLVFNISYHLTILQAFAICLLIHVLISIFNKEKED